MHAPSDPTSPPDDARGTPSTDVFIELTGVGKTYSRKSWFRRVLGRMARDSELEEDDLDDEPEPDEASPQPDNDHTHEALRNVTLAIRAGEIVGVVGRTGSGKSTLLNIISNLTLPTSGTLRGRGRIVPLHVFRRPMDSLISGRRNLELFGHMHGFSRAEVDPAIARAVDDCAFRAKIDQRVTLYASQDFMQLGYSFALHLNPDILVIDGPLAVGDAHNQKAFLDRLFAFPNDSRILIICTPKLSLLRQACHRVLWLDGGSVAADGPPEPVIKGYLQTASGDAASSGGAAASSGDYQNGPAWFLDFGFGSFLGKLIRDGNIVAVLAAGAPKASSRADTGVRAPAIPDAPIPSVPGPDAAAPAVAPADVIAALRAQEAAQAPDFAPLDLPMSVWGTLKSVRLLTRDGHPTQVAAPGEALVVEVSVEVVRPDTRVDLLAALAVSPGMEELRTKGVETFVPRPVLFTRLPDDTTLAHPGPYRLHIDLPAFLGAQGLDDCVMALSLTLVMRNGSPGFGGVNRADLSIRQIVDILCRLEAGEDLAEIVPVPDEPPTGQVELKLRDQLLANLPPLPKATANVSLAWFLMGSLNTETIQTTYTSPVKRGHALLRAALPMTIERAVDGPA